MTKSRPFVALMFLLCIVGCGGDNLVEPSPQPTFTPAVLTGPLFVRGPEVSTARSVTIFEVPSDMQGLQIQASYPGRSVHFTVRIGDEVVFNDVLGSFWGRHGTGTTIQTKGGMVEVFVDEPQVTWSLNELRL